MDFGAREILILLGILVVVAILLDSIRRVGRSRRGKLRTSTRRSSRSAAIFDDDDEYPGELPGRGSRVVKVRDERSAEEVSEKIKRECDTRTKFTSPFKARGEKPLPDRDPGIFDDLADSDAPVVNAEPLPSQSAPPLREPLQREPLQREHPQREPPPFTAADDDDVMADEPVRDAPSAPRRPPPEARPEPPRQPAAAQPSQSQRADASATTGKTAGSGAGPAAQEDILILHLMAHKGQFFDGEKLLEQLLDHGLRYGAMRIFHRHETRDGAGPVHFSVANSVNPGVFDLNIMDQFSTPGVTFIMPLDGLEKPLESFETLINTAVGMARKLDGELKDETRSAFTKQTIEHYRQRIIDFTRRSFTLTN